MAVDDESRQSDLAVMDAQEFDQKRRLKRLHERLEDYHATKNEANNLFLTGSISEDGAAILMLHSVQNIIEELWELSIDERRAEYNEYWNNYPVDRDHSIGMISFEHREPEVIADLWDVLTAQEYYTEAWTEEHHRRHGSTETVRHTQEQVFPKRLTRNAYLRCKEYLSDVHDMQLKFEALDDTLPMFGYTEVDENGE